MLRADSTNKYFKAWTTTFLAFLKLSSDASKYEYKWVSKAFLFIIQTQQLYTSSICLKFSSDIIGLSPTTLWPVAVEKIGLQYISFSKFLFFCECELMIVSVT